MDEKQKYLSTLDYKSEQEALVDQNTLEMLRLGIPAEYIAEDYTEYAIQKQPTFSTPTEQNPDLQLFTGIAEIIKNPALRETEEADQLYKDYLDFRVNASISDSSMILKGTDALSRGILRTGVAQRIGSPFKTKMKDLDKDTLKAYEWLQALEGHLDPESAKQFKKLDFAMDVTGIVADTLALQKVVGGDVNTLAKAIRSGNHLKANSFLFREMASKIIAKTTPDAANLTTKFLTGTKIAGQLAEDVLIGTGFSIREVLLNDDFESRETKEKVAGIVSEFGLGFGVDLLINTTANLVLPGVKNYGRIFFKANNGIKSGIKNSDEALDLAISALRGEVDPNTIKKLRKQGMYTAADTLEHIQGEAITIKTLKDAGMNADSQMKVFALANNMQVDKIDGLYHVVMDTTKKTKKIKKVAHLEDVAKMIDNKMLSGLKKTPVEMSRLASITKDLKIEQEFLATLKSANAKLTIPDFIDSVIPKTGRFTAKSKNEGLRFVKAAITDLGDGAKELADDFTVKLSDTFYKNIPSVKSTELSLPRLISSGAELKKYTKYIGDFITYHGSNINGEELDTVLKVLGNATGSWSLNDMDWIAAQAKKAGLKIAKQEGTFIVDDGVKLSTFATEDELGNHMLARTLDEKSFESYLNTAKKYTMVKDEDLNKLVVLNQAKSPVAAGESVEEILNNNPMLRPKYPIESAPSLAFVDDSLRKVRFSGDYIEGSVEQIMDYFKNYDNMKVMSDIRDSRVVRRIKKPTGSEVLVNVDKKRWIVTADAYGMTPQTFNSEKELLKFLDGVGTPEKMLTKVAGKKGVAITANRAGFIVSKIGKEDQVFKTLAETSDYVKSLPNKPVTPEVLKKVEHITKMQDELYKEVFKDVNLENYSDDQNISYIKKVADEAYTKRLNETKTPKLPESVQLFFNKFRNNRAVIQGLVKKSPENAQVLKAYHSVLDVEKNMKIVSAKFNQAVNQLAKEVPLKERRTLGELLSKEMPEADLAENYFKLNGKEITPAQLKFTKQIRKLFAQAGELNGFGNSLDTIENYFPKMKTLDPREIFLENNTATSLAEKAYGRKLYPAEEKFFKNMRTIDLAGYAFETDPLKLLIRYTDDTLKTTYIEPAIETFVETGERLLQEDTHGLEAVREIAKHARGLNDDNTTKIFKAINDEIGVKYNQKVADGYMKANKVGKTSNEFLAFVKGETKELSKESIANMTIEEQQLFSKAISKHTFRQNPLNKVMGAVTLGTQAFKPWLPIRNSFQPETHLAPLFGFEAVARSKKQVSELSDEAIRFIGEKGIFQSKSIQAQVGVTGTGAVEKLNEVGLASYKASDDFDRAVGFITVRNALAEGLEVGSHWGDKSGSYFMQHTKLYAAPQDIRANVLDAIHRGDLDDATTTYAQWINDMSFLNYSPIDRPQAFNSFFGKMFGQMGTFSTQTLSARQYFTENLTRGDVAMFIGRAVLGGYALNSAFSEVTGAEVNNFSAHKSMIFAGGPLMQTAWDVTQVIGGTDYSRDRSIDSLGRQVKGVFTPWNTGKNIIQGFGKIMEGETKSGVLQAINAPGKGQEYEFDEGIIKHLKRF